MSTNAHPDHAAIRERAATAHRNFYDLNAAFDEAGQFLRSVPDRISDAYGRGDVEEAQRLLAKEAELKRALPHMEAGMRKAQRAHDDADRELAKVVELPDARGAVQATAAAIDEIAPEMHRRVAAHGAALAHASRVANRAGIHIGAPEHPRNQKHLGDVSAAVVSTLQDTNPPSDFAGGDADRVSIPMAIPGVGR